jgi:hypothetical protein
VFFHLGEGDFGPGDDRNTFRSQAKWPKWPFCAGLRVEEGRDWELVAGGREIPLKIGVDFEGYGVKKTRFSSKIPCFPRT